MRHIKRIIIGVGVVFVILFLTLVTSFSFFGSTSEAPEDLLTTNIDYKNKTIRLDNAESATTTIKKSYLDYSTVVDYYQSFLESLSTLGVYQSLASVIPGVPSKKYIKIYPGERKEQIADKLASKFKWKDKDKKEFLNAFEPINITNDGYYYPGFYVTNSNATSVEVREMLFSKFHKDIASRYPTTTAEQVPLNVALTIASIIEREASGKEDMALVSGVIWNRIFTGMNLQVDATLQYAKGKQGNWWPIVLSKDKFINSAFNTYKHNGLPPSPISNVSLATLQAALNPTKKNCLFYLHDKHRTFRCSETYQGHLDNIRKYLK